jgi:ribosomal-protein-alanine N-acetyltransferase
VAEVSRVERRCFEHPWPLAAYRRELRNRAQNSYVVLRAIPETGPEANGLSHGSGNGKGHGLGRAGESHRLLSRLPLPLPLPRRWTLDPNLPHVAGFAGMWTVFDEAHITTIGVDPAYRGRGLGELLLVTLLDEAVRRGANWLTLEVRVSNEVAQRLYRKYGFGIHSTRRRYYSDNGEDAYIMWSRPLRDPAYLAEIAVLRDHLCRRLAPVCPVPALREARWVGI